MSYMTVHQAPRRTLIGGYRVGDVEVLLAQLRLLVAQLEDELAITRNRAEVSDTERRFIDERYEELQRREASLAASLAEFERTQIDAVQAAALRAREVVATAQEEAAELLEQATAEARAARSEIDELLRLRGELNLAVSEIARHFERTVGLTPGASTQSLQSQSLQSTWDAPAEQQVDPPAVRQPATPPTALPSPAAMPGELFDRRIEVDAGPFLDVASLSAFEDALVSLPKVADVYTRSFEGERATIDVTLEEPARLLDHMTERLPYRLDVNSAVPDRISVTVRAA